MSDPDEEQMALSMYEWLRGEIDQSNELQNRIAFGQAVLVGIGIGVSTVAEVEGGKVPDYILSVGLGALPVIVATSTAAWLLEQARVMRAGNYLSEVEDYLKYDTDKDLIMWETWLRSDRSERYGIYRPEQGDKTDTPDEEVGEGEDGWAGRAASKVRGLFLQLRKVPSRLHGFDSTDSHDVYDISFLIGYPVYFVALGSASGLLACKYGNWLSPYIAVPSVVAIGGLSYMAHRQITHSAHRV